MILFRFISTVIPTNDLSHACADELTNNKSLHFHVVFSPLSFVLSIFSVKLYISNTHITSKQTSSFWTKVLKQNKCSALRYMYQCGMHAVRHTNLLLSYHSFSEMSFTSWTIYFSLFPYILGCLETISRGKLFLTITLIAFALKLIHRSNPFCSSSNENDDKTKILLFMYNNFHNAYINI